MRFVQILYAYFLQELRRRRIDQSVELRKAKKNEQLQKRRNVLDNVEEISPLKDVQVCNSLLLLI